MEDKIPQREIRPFDQDDVDRAAKLVDSELGNNFDIEYGELPRNVGATGDEGVRGDTVMITTDAERPAVAFTQIYKQLGQVATQITNETTATKVIIDITSKRVTPTFLIESSKNKFVPTFFSDYVKRRLEGYPLLNRKYHHQLDDNPILQRHVSAIMDLKNAELRANLMRKIAEEKLGKD